MLKETLPGRLNKMVIMIILGTFVMLQVLYIPVDYVWAFDAISHFVKNMVRP